MKMQRTPLVVLIQLIFLVYACNSLQDDVLEPVPAEETLETSTLPDEAIVIDLIEKHQASNPTRFELKNQPQHGEARFIKTGLLLYQPGSSARQGISDRLEYDVCRDGDCRKFDVNIRFSNDSTGRNACVPPLRIYVDENQELSISLPILLDSAYFSANIDFSTVEIIGEPIFGQASYQNETLTYTPPSEINDSLPFRDLVVYQFETPGDSSYQCHGVIEFFRPGIRIPQPNPNDSLWLSDDYICLFGDTAVDVCVTDNDHFDLDQVDPASFTIVQGPQSGVATARFENGKGTINYDPNQGFLGTDYVVYELGYTNGQKAQAQLEIVILEDSAAWGGRNDTLDLVAIDDTYTLSLSGDTLQLRMNVLENDSIEAWFLNDISLEVLERPNIGQVQAGQNAIWFFLDANNLPQAGSQTEFTYQICDRRNWCSQATVTVIFEQ